ncbi:hypothetical protein [Agrobacterium sp. MS2]|uniref:helix-turn-helix domain-containing protein n=1 Tax=Agrobacterium sp. MS2 TaxID=1345498 RepID=UPI00256EFA5A|nr:hypothetical protein [Agrobacterium sp. MS2]
MTASRDKDDMTEHEVKSFTSWKLDIIEAISCDLALEPIDKIVAFRVMQHINMRSRDANPSLNRIAAQLGVHRDTVKRSLKRLCDPTGGKLWMTRSRSSRTESYSYQFVTDRFNIVMDAKIAREEEAKEKAIATKRNRLEVARKHPREVANVHSHEVARVHHGEGADVHPKHLQYNHLIETPFNSCSEGSESLYSDSDQSSAGVRPSAARNIPYPVPANDFIGRQMVLSIVDDRDVPEVIQEKMQQFIMLGILTPAMAERLIAPAVQIPDQESEFNSWITRNIPDRANHREAYRLLRERKMTPEVLRRLAA